MEDEQGNGEEQPGRSDRRSFLTKAAVGGAVAWSAPVLLSGTAAAAGSTAPVTINAARDTDFDGPSIFGGTPPFSRSITLSSASADLQPGDLWMALLAYDRRSSVIIPGDLAVFGPVDQGNGTVGIEVNYTVRAYVAYKWILAGDLGGATFSRTFTTPVDNEFRGGLRGCCVAYRGASNVAFTSGNGSGPVGAGQIVTATFPAASGTPLPFPSTTVRFGAVRGYGGCNALSPNNDWQTLPGTPRIDYSTTNEGDRALGVSDETNVAGASTVGTWYRQVPVLCSADPNWVTFTAALTV